MLKSTLIATCLYQSRLISDIPTGELAVKNIFDEYFPRYSFDLWNNNLSIDVVNHYLKTAKGASTIRVNLFIEDLWDL